MEAKSDTREHVEAPEERGNFLGHAWQRLSSWRKYLPFGARHAAPRFDPVETEQLMRECLDGIGGEIAARSRAAELGYLYLNLPQEEKAAFLGLLASRFDIDRAALGQAAARYAEEPSATNYRALQLASQPARVGILKRLNSLPDGFKFLVELRADLLSFLEDTPDLARLDHDLRGLFEAWFDVGLLTFERITWDSSAALLERLVAYEAVHQIRSWEDLKNRLGIDRRCYAFFHPKIPADPLIFVEVALTVGVPSEIQTLLDETAPKVDADVADTAAFYSISSTQEGLRGISFGSFLLKRVMEDLSAQLPHVKRFVTLSPIPGFRQWLLDVHAEEGDALFEAGERERLERLLEAKGTSEGVSKGATEGASIGATTGIRALLESPDWADDPEIAAALREPLLDLCAHYLLTERRRDKPLDPVARFHVTNGASVEQLNYLADTSESGMRQSLGLMVNYRYSPDKLETNHERFFRSGEIVAAGDVARRASRRDVTRENR